MKKRFLCAALALSLFASFASAEEITLLQGRKDLPPRQPRPPAKPMHGPHLDDTIILGALLAALSDSTYLSISVPFPIQGENFNFATDGLASDWTWGWGIGVDATFFLAQRVGLHISSDFYFPVASLTNGGGTSYSGNSFGYSFFMGPSFAAVRTERIIFAIAPGIHLATLDIEQGPYSISRFMFGLGASMELDIILSSLFFVRAGLDVTYDFTGVELLKSYGNRERNNFRDLNIVPSVGLGFWI